MDIRPALAHARFGLGRSPDDPLPADPQAWLAAQLRGPDPGPAGASTVDAATTITAFLAARKEAVAAGQPAPPNPARQIFLAETAALQDYAHGHAEPVPRAAGLVLGQPFHRQPAARRRRLIAGAYVREAIRPHVTGRFADMLLAVMRHPAMLLYLDNAGSAGPDSVAGLRQHRGLNENLGARDAWSCTRSAPPLATPRPM